MKAKITAEQGYQIYVLGQLHTYNCGDIVEGHVAVRAVEDKAAAEEVPAKAPPENKAVKPKKTKTKKGS